jgi:hypothetical protein
MSRHEGIAALVAGLLAALGLAVTHLAFWHRPQSWIWTKYGRVGAYGIGTAILQVAFTLYCALTGQGRAARASWLIAGLGGATVLGCWLARVPAPMRRVVGTALRWPVSEMDPTRVYWPQSEIQ